MTRRTDDPASRLPVPAGALPAFDPVPRQRMRRGGWSAERQRTFIEALAETGSVRAACRRLGVGEHHIYKLRRHPEAASFRKAWEAALDLGIQRIEDVAMDRALNGVEVPVYHAGELVGTRRAYNDRLLMFMLQNRSPERYGSAAAHRERRLDAIGKMEKRRLKKKWRKQWEEERAARSGVTAAEVRASIDRKVEGIRRAVEADRAREWERMSEKTREAWERFVELRDADFARLKADEAFQRKHERGPNVYEEWSTPPEKKVVAVKEPKTVHKLTDDGWE